MSVEFPHKFTLENGTHVIVKKLDNNHYDFTIAPEDGEESHFSYNSNDTFDDEMEEKLSFDQLDALRRFWLKLE